MQPVGYITASRRCPAGSALVIPLLSLFPSDDSFVSRAPQSRLSALLLAFSWAVPAALLSSVVGATAGAPLKSCFLAAKCRRRGLFPRSDLCLLHHFPEVIKRWVATSLAPTGTSLPPFLRAFLRAGSEVLRVPPPLLICKSCCCLFASLPAV